MKWAWPTCLSPSDVVSGCLLLLVLVLCYGGHPAFMCLNSNLNACLQLQCSVLRAGLGDERVRLCKSHGTSS
jgi:hypothetical protein